MTRTGESMKKPNKYLFVYIHTYTHTQKIKYLSFSELMAQGNSCQIPAYHPDNKPVNSAIYHAYRQLCFLLLSRTKQYLGHQQHTWPFDMR